MKRFLTPRMRIALGAAIVLIITIFAVLYAPPEGEANNTSGDLPPGTQTVVVTDQRASTTISHNILFRGVHILVKDATLATKFSDDHKRWGNYTLRIRVDAINKSNTVVGIEYASLVYLLVPDSQKIPTKLISIKADALPGELQSGFFDFPLSTPTPLSELKIQFTGGPIVPLSNR